jgi:transcriptional regulator with XRE-family HTH domain
MARKRTAGQHELSDVLKRLRGEARLTIQGLAKISGVSARPIKGIENEGRIPKASTLRQIADGLATYAPGRRDQELADEYYRQLMEAADYSSPGTASEPAASIRDAESIVRKSLEARYGEDARFVEAVLDRLEREPEKRRKTVLDLLLYGIGDAIGRPPDTRTLAVSR